MSISCTLCTELAGNAEPYLGRSYGRLIQTGKNILLNSENFVVLPSVGALHPSHVLIVPKVHVCNFASLPRRYLSSELELIKDALRRVNRAKGFGVVFFEHGMGTVSDTSGACVSHAHLHVIIQLNVLEDEIRRRIAFARLPEFHLVKDLASTKEGYVVFENSDSEISLCNRPELPSQFFRRLFAEIAGEPRIWNWRIDKQDYVTTQAVKHYERLVSEYGATL